ncbi:MAG: type II toxin-antitoxin system RelE/ParE family toxin [Burkholderiales bacterium]|nr:type II toxin-antitoxin system RelE/ParE family toxin [Burkholderiales bacterium]
MLHYCTSTGIDVFGSWFDGLRDTTAQARVAVRVDRLARGLFGDSKALRDGVRELRVDHGPGYRVYYALAGRVVVVLLCGGDKRTQRADIARAVGYWVEFQERQR